MTERSLADMPVPGNVDLVAVGNQWAWVSKRSGKVVGLDRWEDCWNLVANGLLHVDSVNTGREGWHSDFYLAGGK